MFPCWHLLAFSTLLFQTVFSSLAFEIQPRSQDFVFFDSIGQEDFFDPFELELFDTGIMQTRSVGPDVIVPILIAQADILQILQESLFLHTNTLNKRPLLDRPLFEDFVRVYICEAGFVGMQLFASMMSRGNFTKNSTDMDSYLALQEPSLITKLEDVVAKLKPLFANPADNIDITRLLSLFKPMTVQERAGGAMLFGGKYWDNNRLMIQIPFYYFERNFSLTDEERLLVEAEFGKLGPKEQEEFQKNHMISDKVGFGDMRIQFDTCLVNKEYSTLYGGVFTTLPTAFAINQGMLGRSFPKPCTFPSFSFTELFDLALNPTPANQEKAFTILSDFLLGAVDRMAANLLDTSLGNGGHLGIGGYLTLDIPFSRWFEGLNAHNTIFENRISLEYYFPNTEKRFFTNKINPKLFDPSLFINPLSPVIDPIKAAKNLAFLESEFVQRLYLRAFSVSIHPRPIFRYISKISYLGDALIATAGLDSWLQGVNGISPINYQSIQDQVCFSKVYPPIAYQIDLFGSISYNSGDNHKGWLFTISGDYTLFKKGIGKLWGLAFGIERLF